MARRARRLSAHPPCASRKPTGRRAGNPVCSACGRCLATARAPTRLLARGRYASAKRTLGPNLWRGSRVARIPAPVAARSRCAPGCPGIHRHVRQHPRRAVPRSAALIARHPAHFRLRRSQNRDLRAARPRCAAAIPKWRARSRRAAEAAKFGAKTRFACGTLFTVSMHCEHSLCAKCVSASRAIIRSYSKHERPN